MPENRERGGPKATPPATGLFLNNLRSVSWSSPRRTPTSWSRARPSRSVRTRTSGPRLWGRPDGSWKTPSFPWPLPGAGGRYPNALCGLTPL